MWPKHAHAQMEPMKKLMAHVLCARPSKCLWMTCVIASITTIRRSQGFADHVSRKLMGHSVKETFFECFYIKIYYLYCFSLFNLIFIGMIPIIENSIFN